jgi:hypothetical protein
VVVQSHSKQLDISPSSSYPDPSSTRSTYCGADVSATDRVDPHLALLPPHTPNPAYADAPGGQRLDSAPPVSNNDVTQADPLPCPVCAHHSSNTGVYPRSLPKFHPI